MQYSKSRYDMLVQFARALAAEGSTKETLVLRCTRAITCGNMTNQFQVLML